MRKRAILVFSGLLIAALPCLAGWDEGVAAFASKNYQAAAVEFRKVIRQKPQNPRGHYMLGLSLDMLNRKEKALHHLRKAYDLNPNDLGIKVALGRSYADNRQYPKAERILQAALKNQTKPKDLKIIWRQLGYTYEKQKKFSKSIEAYQNAGDERSVARVKRTRTRKKR